MTPDELLVECADALQSWQGLGHLGATEVLAWWDEDEPRFVFRGPTLRMQNYLFREPYQINNYQGYLGSSLNSAFGSNVYNSLTTPRADITEIIEMVQQVLVDAFASEGHEAYPRVTLMPAEGSPWNPDDDATPFYSAKKRKFFETPRPDYLTVTQARDPETGGTVDALGVDFCKLVDTIGAGDRSGSFVLDGLDEGVLVTHCLGFERGVDADGVSGFVNSCGGLLFPSLAVGPLPAANFGPICLVFDPMIVLQSMKPYKKGRGAWPIVTYTTDVWTATMSTFLGDAAVQCFEQLTGHAGDFMYNYERHFWILGPPVDVDAGPATAKIVKGTKQLRAALKRRGKTWHRDIDAREIEETQAILGEDRYPYLEAKSNGIVGVDAMVGCAYPEAFAAEAERFLGAIGFRGAYISLDMPYASHDPVLTYDWSWAVHDAVLHSGLTVRNVQLG